MLVLERDASLERLDVVLAVEEEQVPDLPQVDLPARPLGEALVCLDAPHAERDVQRVGELRPDSAGGAARRARCKLGPLEDAYADAGLREVEPDARAHDTSADHDDLGARGKNLAHPRTRLRRKKKRFAGRSARRRIRYGYQSGP